MKCCVGVVAILGAALAAIHDAEAHVVIHVDKSSQRMTVSVDGNARYSFVVSTGRAGYGTPNGVYHPVRMARTWFSKKYYNSPMPHSIFFRGGYAIHGSYEISRLGGPASHGCIRLHPTDATELYTLVQQQGMGATTIVVSGSNPTYHAAARDREPRSSMWRVNRSYGQDVGAYSDPYAGYRLNFAPTVPRPSRYNRAWKPYFFGTDDY
jgi:hypothetical protein